MRKLLKLIIGIISSIILLMYLTLPFVKIGDDKYKVFEYIKYIFDNISMTFKNVELTDVDMLYTVVAWLLMFIIVIVPIISLVVISIKGLLSGLLSKKKLKVIYLECLSFVFAGTLIALSYYLVYKYSLPVDANALQLEFVKMACNNVWQPVLYVSAFGSLLLVGINLLANDIKNKKEEEE